MKRNPNIFRVILLILFSIAFSVLLSGNSPKVQADETDNYIENGSYDYSVTVLKEYYFAVDQYQEINLDKYIADNNVKKYMLGKIEAKNSKKYLHGTDDIQDYKVSFELVDAEEYGNLVKLSIASKISFRYKGSDTNSGYGELNIIKLVKDKTGYAIIGWYNPGGDYDSDISEDWGNSDKWTEEDWDKIFENQKRINSKIKEYYVNESKMSTQDSQGKRKSPSNAKSMYSLSRMNIVS